METIIMHHPFCKISVCRICLEDINALLDFLERKIKKTCDQLGKYRTFLEKKYPEQEWETEWGWPHPDVFKDRYIMEYVNTEGGSYGNHKGSIY